MRTRILFLSILGVLLSACSDHASEVIVDSTDVVQLEGDTQQILGGQKPGMYYFGFDLRSSPQEDAKQYLPFLKYLSDETGYQFELKFTARGKDITDELANGTVQFAAIGAGSYIKADKENRPVSLVRGKNNLGRAEYRSYIVVANDSTIGSLKGLKNKRFAFGGKSSTQGHIIPRIILSKSGLSVTDFASYSYTGSHHKCANAVISGKADACGMQDTMAESMEKQQLIKIIHRSAYYPSSGVVASKHVPAEVQQKVQKALLGFEPEGRHKSMLYNWHKTEMPKGFVASSDADYKKLRDRANKLGLLGE